MADGHNRGRSSQREFAFHSQGLALVEVCLALFERDHGLPPKILEPARRQLGVTHRVLDVSMAQVGLKGPGIVAFVSQREPAGVSQHVGVSLEAQLGLDTSALHHARKACRRERRSPLAGEHERRLGILLPLQLAQSPHFIADNGMRGRRALLRPADVQDGVGEIDLIPTQVD